MKKFDIVIIGGGLVGHTFALDLARRKSAINIALIEARAFIGDKSDDLDNRIYAIAPDNILYLENLGLDLSSLRHGIINKMHVFGDINSNIILDKNITPNQFLAKTFEYKILQRELYLKTSTFNNITLIYDSIKKIERLGGVKIIGEKDIYSANLIVGADGANSFVRQISEIMPQLIDYKQSGIVANFSCPIGHNNIAYQWFKHGEILAYLPLQSKQISIVWSSNNPQKILNMAPTELEDSVSAFGDHKLGRLKLLTAPIAFPLKMHLLNAVYADKVVLIGDAAHTIHPLAGQGVNLGFRDAKILANNLSCIENYQLGEIGILAKYSATRQIAVKKMQLTCHSLYYLFNSENHAARMIRNKGMNWVNKLSFIKKFLIAGAS